MTISVLDALEARLAHKRAWTAELDYAGGIWVPCRDVEGLLRVARAAERLDASLSSTTAYGSPADDLRAALVALNGSEAG